MGNSLQFFDQENILQLLSTINSHLNKGGKFFINTWSIAEIVFKNFKEKNWSKVGDLLFFAESKLSFQPTRVETLSTIITESGEKEEKNMVEYIFSLGELGSMLNKTGFLLNAVYSIPGQKYFSLGDARAYIVAEKI